MRQFKATANTTPGEVHNPLSRMLKALSLQQNKYTLSDIAERVGYQSEAAFSKALKVYLIADRAVEIANRVKCKNLHRVKKNYYFLLEVTSVTLLSKVKTNYICA